MKTRAAKFPPSPSELERDFNDFLSKKYDGAVRVGSVLPMPKGEDLTEEGDQEESKPVQIRFDMKPEELEAYLNKFVIKQVDAKEVLATKICTHFQRAKLPAEGEPVGNIKNNIMLVGPTGVGKTFLLKLIATKLGVPFVKGDATKFSETGYVGGDVEQLVRDLVHEAKGNIELAEFGIIYLDEIDKIAASNSAVGPDVSRTGVQRTLLKLMEDTEVDLKVPHDLASQLEAALKFQKTGKMEHKKVNTKNILFIVSGAFNGLEDIIKRRLNKQGIGFGAHLEAREEERLHYLLQVKSEDLITYGFESEFIGRLPVVVVLEDLEEEDLYQILRNPNCSVVASKKRDFKAYGIDLKFEDEVFREIAHIASQSKIGARGLVSVLERILLKFEKKLPSTSIRHLVVTKAMLDNPVGELEKLLENKDDPTQQEAYKRLLGLEREQVAQAIEEYAQHGFLDKKGFLLPLTEERVRIAAERAVAADKKPETVCEDIWQIEQQVREAEEKFLQLYNLRVRFTPEAVDLIIQSIFTADFQVGDFCRQVLRNYQHGLKLISDNSDIQEFIITREGIENPEVYLNKLIKKIFRRAAQRAVYQQTKTSGKFIGYFPTPSGVRPILYLYQLAIKHIRYHIGCFGLSQAETTKGAPLLLKPFGLRQAETSRKRSRQASRKM